MPPFHFTREDLSHIATAGFTVEQVHEQLAIFEKGAPFARLDRPCTVGDGITRLTPDAVEKALGVYASALGHKTWIKFVPASGAASRMFKGLMEAKNRLLSEPQADLGPDFRAFMDQLHRLALFNDLHKSLAREGLDAHLLIRKGNFGPVLEHLLGGKHLHFQDLPKALIPFHRYGGETRTALEEHFVEAVALGISADHAASVHFTVSPQHRENVAALIRQTQPAHEGRLHTPLSASLSIQAPHTQTIAADMDNRPFRLSDGRLLFRPGGHGALLDNLNQMAADIVFIKNIDNVAHERHLSDIVAWKKILCGVFIQIQDQAFAFLRQLHDSVSNLQDLMRAANWARQTLCRDLPTDAADLMPDELKQLLISTLDRPLRVCGMVPNAGEPGGGPFWVRRPDGGLSLQIVESAQMDVSDPGQRAIAAQATHFNPVDLVCGIRNWRGEVFDLSRYVDEEAVFISSKTEGGKPLKALELPGLWNGAMAYWNTIFVETPAVTFNPVKEVADLLRDGHQPASTTPFT